MENSGPNYQKIYTDMMKKYFSKTEKIHHHYLNKKKLNSLDIIRINKIIADKKKLSITPYNQKLRSYDQESIIKILKFQQQNKLNNSQVAEYFNLSRNTIAKWKKIVFVTPQKQP